MKQTEEAISKPKDFALSMTAGYLKTLQVNKEHAVKLKDDFLNTGVSLPEKFEANLIPDWMI